MEIQVRRRIVGPYDNTTYVLVCAGSNESLIVDCPLPNEEAIVEQATGTNVRGILLTHGHGDHLASLVAVKRHFNVPVHMHPDDYWLLDRWARQGWLGGTGGRRGWAAAEELGAGECHERERGQTTQQRQLASVAAARAIGSRKLT